jgi:hypothetical protein
MTVLVRVNDEDASARFNLVKPAATDVASSASAAAAASDAASAIASASASAASASASTPASVASASAASAPTTDVDDDITKAAVAAAAAKIAGGKSSVLMEEYAGVTAVSVAADGSVVVRMRGGAAR